MNEVPAAVARALKRVQREGGSVLVDGTTVYPPDKRGYWRVQRNVGGQQLNRSGGRSVHSAWAAVQRLHEFLDQQAQSLLGPADAQQANVTVSDILRGYLQGRGPRGRWSDRTLADRGRDFRPLLAMTEQVQVRDLNLTVLQGWLNLSGTHERRRHLANIAGTFLRWAVAMDYLPRDSRDLADRLKYLAAPSGYEVTRRKQQSRSLADASGAIPSHEYVHAWAEQAGHIWAPGEWFIYLLAYTGLRSSEALLLTRDTLLASEGSGNLLDADAYTITVTVQQSRQRSPIPPKGNKTRVVVLPNRDRTNGIDLRNWASKQSREGFVFLNSDGKTWLQDAVYRQVFAKASDQLLSRLPEYSTLTGRRRSLRRFTLHSLRARYATTAINEWGFSRAQLQQQGGWEPGTVERFYQGFDDHTLDSVRKLLSNRVLER